MKIVPNRGSRARGGTHPDLSGIRLGTFSSAVELPRPGFLFPTTLTGVPAAEEGGIRSCTYRAGGRIMAYGLIGSAFGPGVVSIVSARKGFSKEVSSRRLGRIAARCIRAWGQAWDCGTGGDDAETGSDKTCLSAYFEGCGHPDQTCGRSVRLRDGLNLRFAVYRPIVFDCRV